MANLSFTGFHPFGNVASTATMVGRRRVASNNALAFFTGDVLIRATGGVYVQTTAGAGVAAVCQGASFFSTSVNGRIEQPFLPANTTYTATTFDVFGETDESFVYITTDPVNDRFQCQYATGTPALADLTLNSNVVIAAGSTVTGVSGHTLNGTPVVTAARDFTIVDIKHNALNDLVATGAKVIVGINLGHVPPFADVGTAGV